MLMSFEPVDAAGSGTQDDPYHGSVSIRLHDEIEVWAIVGTYLAIGTIGSGSYFDNFQGSGLELSGSVIKGTLSSIGTFHIGFQISGGITPESPLPYTFTLHVVSNVADLIFQSNPITDGVIEYVA